MMKDTALGGSHVSERKNPERCVLVKAGMVLVVELE